MLSSLEARGQLERRSLASTKLQKMTAGGSIDLARVSEHCTGARSMQRKRSRSMTWHGDLDDNNLEQFEQACRYAFKPSIRKGLFDEDFDAGLDSARTWVTADGREIAIQDLPGGHALNILHLMIRKVGQLRKRILLDVLEGAPVKPVEAKKRSQQVVHALSWDTTRLLRRYSRAYEAIEKEVVRRGLTDKHGLDMYASAYAAAEGQEGP